MVKVKHGKLILTFCVCVCVYVCGKLNIFIIIIIIRYNALDHTAPSVLRIIANHSSFGDFNIINSPRAHLNVTNSTDLILHDFTIHTASNNSFLPKNTDAFDLYHSTNVIFRDSNLTVGDDCVAIKEGIKKKKTNIDWENSRKKERKTYIYIYLY